ncbi:TrfB-related DNA-binding protein [Halomonas sp. MM17-34]|jgi:predicted DNA-binding protein YlxM (UPF0122 family)|uniref:TrfB-related DNA-binding protein n=1 Tax=Halomonas sp. MM17-34 TaxID=2917742 RepID=UPI001EF41195|nr:TrfB-related DNA-binding protein [Halomonas sp. MM17-34]MCG7605417.1 transcriptional regulator KorA [Halomonas sp. MM17-34]
MTAQTKDPVKYSAAEWEQLQPALRSLSVSTISTAQQVLVEGRSAPDVAKELGCARQTVHAAVKRVRARLEKYEAAELAPVLVWVPQEAVEAVKDHAREQGGVVEGDKPKAKRKKATKAAAKAK